MKLDYKMQDMKDMKENQPTMKKLRKMCIEIINENIVKWKERKKDE